MFDFYDLYCGKSFNKFQLYCIFHTKYKIAYKKGYKILLYFEIPTVPEMLTHGLHDHDSKPILYLPLIELNSVATVLSCHILKISCSVDL